MTTARQKVLEWWPNANIRERFDIHRTRYFDVLLGDTIICSASTESAAWRAALRKLTTKGNCNEYV